MWPFPKRVYRCYLCLAPTNSPVWHSGLSESAGFPACRRCDTAKMAEDEEQRRGVASKWITRRTEIEKQRDDHA
jgi:hypothetical protein